MRQSQTLDVTGLLEGKPPDYTKIDMTVTTEHSDWALMEELFLISEQSCIVASTLKNAVELSIKLGEPVSLPYMSGSSIRYTTILSINS